MGQAPPGKRRDRRAEKHEAAAEQQYTQRSPHQEGRRPPLKQMGGHPAKASAQQENRNHMPEMYGHHVGHKILLPFLLGLIGLVVGASGLTAHRPRTTLAPAPEESWGNLWRNHGEIKRTTDRSDPHCAPPRKPGQQPRATSACRLSFRPAQTALATPFHPKLRGTDAATHSSHRAPHSMRNGRRLAAVV